MFYLNDHLSDLVIVDGDTGKKYNCHRVVMASASKLIRNFLSTSSENTLELNKLTANFELKVPRRYVRMRIAEEDNIIFEQIILRYIYENQDFERVKVLINNKRVASVLDMAMVLEMDSLF
jgi:hypothetical protein